MADTAPEIETETPALDVTHRPHASLSPLGFALFMALICIAGMATSTAFFLIGAWPVPGFMGLDIVLIYLALRASYRRARRWERLRLTRSALTIERGDRDGRVHRWSFQPYWLRVEMDEPPRPGSRLVLASHGARFEIGAQLGVEERAALARRLRDALAGLKDATFRAGYSPSTSNIE
jgi:uncharacterized membrane protein